LAEKAKWFLCCFIALRGYPGLGKTIAQRFGGLYPKMEVLPNASNDIHQKRQLRIGRAICMIYRQQLNAINEEGTPPHHPFD